MVNKIFRLLVPPRARVQLACIFLRVTTEARHSINSGPLCATDHLFATRIIKVNESSAARVGPMARRE